MTRGLIIFAREPVPGRTKTRLAAAIGNQASAAISAAMLDDVLSNTGRMKAVRRLLFWAGDGALSSANGTGAGCEQFVQREGELGERMADAFRRAFGLGLESCCILGSDLPDLPIDYVEKAFQLLEQGEADVVFGPAADGGYYLLGMRRLWPVLFEGIAWGTSEVLKTSQELAEASGARVALLPEWRDVDTIEDLRRLARTPGAAAVTGRLLEQLPSIHHLLAGGAS